MKKLVLTTTILLLTTFWAANTCLGQVSFEDMKNPPKTDAEAMKYINKYLKPKINDTLIAQLFEEADVVFEGEIIEGKALWDKQQNAYFLEPYKIFKGKVSNDDTITILAKWKPENATYDLGEWSHGRLEVGLFFVKKDPQNKELYRFVNPKNAWVTYATWLIHPITFEKQYKKVLYDKMLKQKDAKYEKTKFYYKKKESLNVGIAAMKSGSDVITGFSRDTVPAGVLSGASRMTIYGNGFGTVKGNVLMEDANQANTFVALHPTHNILYWSDDSIQIVVPSMGYASDNPNLGDSRNSCAGTGYVRVIKGTGPPFPIWSETELIIPYAIKNYASNSDNELTYAPHEVHLRNANGQGGYTFVYDTSFYNNAPALAAFRRSLKTWRCATGINLKDICIADTICQTDESSTRVLVSFAKNCFPTSNPTVLATTRITQKLDPGCPQPTYFTDSITLAFRPPNELLYSCPTGACPAVWNYDTLPNSAANAYNFEKVATHELGHVLMLQHVIDSTSLMHYNTHPGAGADANLTSPDIGTLQGMNYIVGRDTTQIAGCTTTHLLLLNPCGNGSGKTEDIQDDETLCFIDLRLRDNEWDTGQEPNYSAGIDGDGDGWSLTSPSDWEAIWHSPDLWNCPDNDNCMADAEGVPYEIYTNKMGFRIHNAHPNTISDPALLHLYYTMGSTGELWNIAWVDNFYLNSTGTSTCRVGDELTSSPVTIPAIDPQDAYTGWATWSPPNFTNPDIVQYADPNTCGLSPQTDPADGMPKYEICLLARLESAQDPIVGETNPGSVRDNVFNSNNIVTNNYFMPIAGEGAGGGLPPIVPGRPSVILVANSNDEVRYLDILFNKFTNGSVEALQDIMEISFVLAPELWEKWQSTGAVGEGVQVIDEREVKITNMETAKLLNIPFDAREFQPIAIKVTFLTANGKRESLPLLPDNYGFRITHQSSNGSPITKPSNCLFMVDDIHNKLQSVQNIAAGQLTCTPNPFSTEFNVQFFLADDQTVSLALYDLQGRLQKTALNQQTLSKGKQNIAIDTNNLPSGVYICQLITSDKQITQKVVKVN